MEDSKQEIQNSVIVRRLTKSYGTLKAIDNVSFRIGKGEILGFLGPNGAGKSTTMRIIAGLSQATSGSVHVCGVSVASYPHLAKSHIGFMPENNPLPEDVRVIEYLRYRARLKDVEHKLLKKRVDEVMEICQLQRKASRKIIGNLSKGFRQRVGIADAILAKPDVIIMDEPTIGLDPHQIMAIRELIHSLRGKMSVIISSHILPEIELVCDRAIIINQGEVVASGTPDSLRKEFLPVNRYKISIRAGTPELKAFLKGLGMKLEIVRSSKQDADGYFEHILKSPDSERLGADIIREFSKNGDFALREMAVQKPSLEEVFMSATRRSWEQTRTDPNRAVDAQKEGADHEKI